MTDRQNQMMMSENATYWTRVVLIAGTGMVALLVLARWAKSREDAQANSEGANDYGGGFFDAFKPKPAESIQDAAKRIASTHFTVDGCQITWLNTGSQLSLASHVQDFFSPAVTHVQTAGTQGLDAITDAIFGMLVPGCQRPPVLATFDLDKALAKQLSYTQQAAFAVAMNAPTVQLYLAIRAQVQALLNR